MRKPLIPSLAASLFVLALPLGGHAESPSSTRHEAGRGHGHHTHASHHGMGGQSGMMRMGGREQGASAMSPGAWLRGLDLTETQRDKVFEIMHAQAPRMREQAKLVRTARTELGGLATAPSLDPAQLKAASDKLARALADMSAARVGTRNQIFQLLTPEQKQKLQAGLAQYGDRKGGGHGMGPDGHRKGGGHGMGPDGHRPGHPGGSHRPVGPA